MGVAYLGCFNPDVNGSPGEIMPQRGTTTMALYFLAALIVFGGEIYRYTSGRSVQWSWLLFGVVFAGLGVYFKTVRRPT